MPRKPTMTPVDPITPPVPYVGGKMRLAETVIRRIGRVRHSLYCERFVGMGGVFLRRNKRPPAEVVNDRGGDVVNLFRVARKHLQALHGELDLRLHARQDYEALRAIDPRSLTDVERAARFLILQAGGFGGKVIGRSFGIDRRSTARFSVERLRVRLEELNDRLAHVCIEGLDFEECLQRYDGPGTLFYVDPPYLGTERFYGRDLFTRADHTRLRDALLRIKGAAIVSLNDCPDVRELYTGFRIAAVPVARGLGHTTGKEVIITKRRKRR